MLRKLRSFFKARAHILVLCCLGIVLPSYAESPGAGVTIRGMDMPGYGRIFLQLPRLATSEVAIKNSILIWTFDRPLVMRVDKLPTELAQYIAGARLDPDGRTLRLALVQPVRINLQEAGFDYYLDLLPKSWTADNPPVPAEIVRDLSRRVRDAEADRLARNAALERVIGFEGGDGNSLSLLRVLAPDPATIKIVTNQNSLELQFAGRYRIDKDRLTSVLPKSVRFVRAEQFGDGFKITLALDSKLEIKSHIEDQALVIEFHRRNSGRLDLNDLDAFRRGEWTGSISEPPSYDDTMQKNRISFAREGDSDVIEINIGQDVAFASFVADGNVFLLLATDEDFAPPEIPKIASSVITSVAPVGAAHMTGFAIRLRAPRFPHLEKTPSGYRITLAKMPDDTLQDINFAIVPDKLDELRVVFPLADAADLMNVQDPDTGASFFVVPSHIAGIGMRSPYRFQEFAIEASVQGLAIRKFTDDITVSMDAGAVVVSRPHGLNGVRFPDHENRTPDHGLRSVIKAQNYSIDYRDDPLQVIRRQTDRVMKADPRDRSASRIRLARIYAALNLFSEAAGMFSRALSERVPVPMEPQDEIELLLYRTLAGETTESFARLSRSDLNAYPDAALLLAYHYARQGRMSESLAAYRASGSVLASYPAVLVKPILPVLAEAAIEVQDVNLSANLVTALGAYVDDGSRDFYRYLSARYLDLSGQKDDAGAMLDDLVNSTDRRVSVRARLAELIRNQNQTPDAISNRLDDYLGLQTIWRGDWVETRIMLELAKLSFQAGRWRPGFLAMQTVNRFYADAPGARTLLDTATTQLERLFDDHAEKRIGAVETIALFMDFREFMPVGRRGDDLIRKLVDKLVDLDLLPQAAELMRYQIDNRLEGSARAQAAPRLAYVYLLDKRPEDALAVLNATRMNGLGDDLQRARLLLEARSRADLGDVTGAFELIETLSGDDVARLRAEIAWRSQDWKRAAELSELAIGDGWRTPEMFHDDTALYAVRAAIGYTLNADRLSLDRIRGRYLDKFGDRPDSAAFRFLTAPTTKRSPFESEYAANYKGGSTIDGFLKFYRENYLDRPSTRNQANAAP